MKRYKMIPKYTHLSPISDTERCGAILADPIEDPEGEWVKWEDVENLLNNLGHNASVAGFHHRISQIEDVQECNCAEHIYTDVPLGPTTWICSAHGYKRR